MILTIGVFETTAGRCVRKLTRGQRFQLTQDTAYILKPIGQGKSHVLDAVWNAEFAILKTGPVIGRFRGHSIHEWLKMRDGKTCYYAGVATRRLDLDRIRDGGFFLSTGLLYGDQSQAYVLDQAK